MPTKESIVSVRLEQFFDAIQIESEWQEDFHVGLVLEQCSIDRSCVLELAHADGIVAFAIALSVQRIHNLYALLVYVLLGVWCDVCMLNVRRE